MQIQGHNTQSWEAKGQNKSDTHTESGFKEKGKNALHLLQLGQITT